MVECQLKMQKLDDDNFAALNKITDSGKGHK
jgi:hypothetical protein